MAPMRPWARDRGVVCFDFCGLPDVEGILGVEGASPRWISWGCQAGLWTKGVLLE
jgi:hypothetical protein